MKLQKRFYNDLKLLFPHGLPDRLGIALSGGIDSMCLTHLLQKCFHENHIKTEIYPITVNHNLRHTSSLEIPIIRNQLTKINLSQNYITKSIHLPIDQIESKKSFEELARIERYKALTETCGTNNLKDILLAHHLDDQIETFTLRLFKNSGIFGLYGMRPISKSSINLRPNRLNLVRPMLNVDKASIYQYCLYNNIEWVQDFSNFEDITTRNIIRNYFKDNAEIKSNVLKNLKNVQDFNHLLDDKIYNLFHKLKNEKGITMNSFEGIVRSKQDDLLKHSELVISRLLFKLFYVMSPSKNYHYSYEKLLKKSRFWESECTFTLLQLKWNVQLIKDEVIIKVTRQTPKYPVEKPFVLPGNTLTDWIDFDNRFWFKFSNHDSQTKYYTLKTLTRSDKSKFIKLPHDYRFSKFANIPVLIDQLTDKIVSLPTIQKSEQWEWCWKENIYSFNDIHNSTITGPSSSSSSS